MSKGDLFTRKSLIILIASGLALFGGAMTLMILHGSSGQARSSSASAYSDSAIGHHAFANLLRELDYSVLISRNKSVEKAATDHLLIVAEPNEGRAWQDLAERIYHVGATLLVLPKWSGRTDPDKPIWIAQADLMSKGRVEQVLRELLPDSRIFRRPIPSPVWAQTMTFEPFLEQPQLVISEDLEPLIRSHHGILLGRIKWAESIYILSDPDILSNHGLGLGDNAPLLIEAIERIRRDQDIQEGSVIIDETSHGFLRVPNRLRILLEYPLVTITFLALISMGLLAWSGSERFGAPKRAHNGADTGKAQLIENTVRLLDGARQEQEVVWRYRQILLRDLAQRLQKNTRIDERHIANHLVELESRRGWPARIRLILSDLDAATTRSQTNRRRLLYLAKALYDWRKDFLDGTGKPPDSLR